MSTSVGEQSKLKEPNPETVMLAFEESRDIVARLDAWIDAIDQKIVTVFTLASALAGLVPAVADTTSTIWAWRLGGLAWIVTAILCTRGLWPQKAAVCPSPYRIYTPRWLARDAEEYRMKRLGSLGSVYLENVALIRLKARLLRYAMVAAAGEIALFGLAMFL